MKSFSWLLGICLCACTGQAKADPILYQNGTFGVGTSYGPISHGYERANSFSLAADSVLTSATVAFYDTNGAPLSVDWAIVPASVGPSNLFNPANAIASGTGSLTTLQSSGVLYESTFSLPNVVLNSGSYFLVLGNGVSPNHSTTVYWEGYHPPSPPAFYAGYHNQQISDQNPGSGIFSLSGQAVPEPTTLALFGLMTTAGVGLRAWRRRKATIGQ